MSKFLVAFLFVAVISVCYAFPTATDPTAATDGNSATSATAATSSTLARARRQLVNAVVDTAKSAGHGVAAVGSGLTLQGDKAGDHANASVNRAGDVLGDLGRAIYNPNKP